MVGNSQTPADFRSIEYLAMIMREHLPEATKGFGWNIEAQLGDISFQKSCDKILTPLVGSRFARREKRPWESASYP